MEFFDIYLPVAEVKSNILSLIVMGLLTGIMSGLFGLGGGLIIIPYLLLIGVPVPIAIVTATNQMTAGTMSAFISYAKHERVDYKLGLSMLTGSFMGSFIGIIIFNRLSESGKVDTVVPLIFFSILVITCYTMTRDAILTLLHTHRKRNHARFGTSFDLPPNVHFNIPITLPIHVHFISCEKTLSIFSPMLVGFFGGVMVSLVGIGGGFIMVPAMLYLLHIKEQYISGTTIFQIVFTSILSTILHTLTHDSIDLVLAVILIIGTVFGSQVGSRFGTRIDPQKYRILLAAIILIVCIKFAYSIFVAPANLYQIISVTK